MSDDADRATESEAEVLLFFLNRLRDAVVRDSAGLTDEQQRAAGVPSGTSLLGLIQHLTAVEEHWFQRVFLGEDMSVDMSMDVPAGASADQLVAAYRKACARSDEIVRACPDLSTLARSANPGESRLGSLRRIVVHDRGDRAARRSRRHPAGTDRRRHGAVSGGRQLTHGQVPVT
jgi:uncharacterized damage-inducible protein DinB